MKKHRDPSLQIRLAGIAILGLLIALALAAYASGWQVKRDGDLIAQDAVPGTIDAHYMRMAMSRSIGWLLVAASAQSAEFRDSSLKVVHEADVAYAEALKRYEASIRINPVMDRKLLERVKSSQAEFYKKRMAYEALILAGDRDGSAAFLERELVPAFVPTIKAAEDLIKYNHGNSITYANAIRSSVYQLDWTVAVVLVLVLICVVVLLVNFAIRRREVAELQENESKFSNAFKSNPSGIAITDIETGRFIEVNDSYCRIIGYSPQELIGRTSLELGIWENSEERSRKFRPLSTGGTLRDMEMIATARDGSRREISVNADPIELGGRKCVISSVVDITERNELQRRQAELAAIVESSEDAIIGKSLEGVITTWNRGAEKVFGYTAAEIIGQPLLILFPPERRDEEAEILARIGRGETVQHFETVRICKDGRRINISATISPLRDGRGTVIGASKIARDITAQKRAEEALAGSEEMQRHLIKHTPAAVAMFDTEMRYLQASDRWITDYKLEGKEVIGRSHYEVFPDLPEHWKDIHRRVLRGSTDRCDEAMFPRAGGGVEWLQWEIRPWYSTENVIGGLIMFTQVITERKRTESKLRASEELFRTSFESATTGVCLVAKDGKFFNVNRTLCEMIGYTKEELLHLTFNDITHEQDKEIGRSFLDNALAGGSKTMQTEKRYLHKDGHVVWAYLSTAVIDPPQENGCYLISYVQDITQRKQAEEALASTTELLERTSAMAKVGGWELDLASQRVTWSAETARIHEVDFPFEKPLLEKGINFYGPEAWPAIEAAVQAAIVHGTAYDLESPFITAKGNHIWVRVQGFAVIEDGKTTKLRGTFQDITAHKLAKKALREKQAQLLLAMEIARLAHWEFDVKNNSVTVDEHIFQLLGTTAEQEGGQVISPEEYIRRFVHPEDAGIVASEVALGIATTDPHFARQFEHRIIRRDGAERVMLVRSRILLDENGRTGKILGTNQDITEQKQSELRIRHLNRVYEVLSDINKTIVREKDPQRMLAEACRIVVEKGGFRMAWVGMFDAASQKVQPVASAGVVEGYLDQVNIDLRDKVRNCGPSGRCFLSGEHVTCSDMEHDPLMESWRDEALKRGYRSSASFPIRVGGAVNGVFTLYSGEVGFFNEAETLLLDGLAMDIGFALEVSEGEAGRRQAEQELRWRTAFFEAQVHSAIDGILVVDNDGKKLLQNRRMNELWKIPSPIADDPDDSRQLQFVLGRVKEPEVFLQKISHLNAHPDESSTDVIEQLDGTTLERHSAPVRGRDGTYYGRVWTFHDITERKKLEAQFLRAQRMESIGTLASGVAHDLNNILTPIMMSAAVLRMKIADEKRAGLLDTIEMSAARGAQIVKQVLAFGRGLDGERHPLQIEMLLTEMEQMIRSTFPKDITVECVNPPHLWQVLGDATQLHQVLLNLCVNARDAMPGGGTLRLSAANLDIDTSYASMLPEIAPGPHVLLEVSDTGSGIPPEILERIFDPFFTTKEVGKGTGLGLSTVHGIVKSHGGLLKVVTAPVKGTTFQIYLPAAPNQEAMEDAAAAASPPAGHGELVLVVDDEPAITHSARSVLEANGYRVLLANSAIEALVLYTEHSQEVALVLTDLMMPGMNGVLFLRTLRKINPELLVIASTGLCNQAQLDTMKSLGVETVLHKPYNSNTLLRMLDGVLHPKA